MEVLFTCLTQCELLAFLSQRNQRNFNGGEICGEFPIIVCKSQIAYYLLILFGFFHSITTITIDESPASPSLEIIWQRNKIYFIQKSYLLKLTYLFFLRFSNTFLTFLVKFFTIWVTKMSSTRIITNLSR